MILLAVLGWAVSACVCGGKFYTHMQRIGRPEFARESQLDDLLNSIFMGAFCGLLGPVGVIIACCLTSWGSPLWKPRSSSEE